MLILYKKWVLFQNRICRFLVRQDSVAQVVFVKDFAVVLVFLLEGPGITSANLCGIYLFFLLLCSELNWLAPRLC